MANIHLGDTVRVIMMDARYWDYYPQLNDFLGKKGTAVQTNRINGDSRFLVEFEDGNTYWFPEKWLEYQKPKGWTGKVVCIHDGTFHTKGKVYEVKDGIASDDTSTPFNEGNPYKSVDDLNSNCKYAKFIEFKGFAE